MVRSNELSKQLDRFSEWLLIREHKPPFPLFRSEIDAFDDNGHDLLTLIDDLGAGTWRIHSVELQNDEAVINVSADLGKHRETLRLVPRTPTSVLALEIEMARLKKANEIAEALRSSDDAIKLIRVALNKDGGRIVQILYENASRKLFAAVADVTGKMRQDQLFSSSMLWLEALGLRKKRPVNDLMIICEKRIARNAQKLHALLSPRFKAKITIAEIKRNIEPPQITVFARKTISDLWREKQKRFVLPASQLPSRTARAVTALDPGNIDTIYSKHGETVRYLGLPFVRVRTMLGVEKAWFGVGRTRRPLTQDNRDELNGIVREITVNRTSHPTSKRHAYYRTASESWLESLLRRDITQLDANLVLSPVYNQFRSSSDKIDLLALRSDGRLVIIEVKTQPDREVVFQAVDYWRKIELQRRRGDLSAANLFGERQIADKSVLIYLAAPAWSFHRDFEYFARAVAPEIELWRFELHENWRESIKVVARNRYSV